MWLWQENLRRNVRFAARSLWRAPGYCFTAVTILALGIGLNLTLLQFFNAVFWRPLPLKDPETLVRFFRMSRQSESSGFPYSAIEFIGSDVGVFRAVLRQARRDLTWENNSADQVRAAFVSVNWFRELGYAPAWGRDFAVNSEEAENAEPVAIISDDLWQRRFDRSPSILGQSIRLNGHSVNVIGVAPGNFPGVRFENTQLWIPIQHVERLDVEKEFLRGWSRDNTEFFARLHPGLTPAVIQNRLGVALAELARRHPDDFKQEEWAEPVSAVTRFERASDRQQRTMITTLVGTLTLLVLLVACANLSNVVLSRIWARLRELSIRTALGATRWQTLQQLLTESLVIVFLASVGGLMISYWAARLIAVGLRLPQYLDFTPDLRMILAALCIAFITILLTGLLPALKLNRRDLTSSMREGSEQMSGGRERLRGRQILIASQVAGSCVLLLVAGLLVSGLRGALASSESLDFDKIAILQAPLSASGIKGPAARDYWQNLKRKLESHPDFVKTALASEGIFIGGAAQSTYRGMPRLRVVRANVEPDFFSLMGLRIVAGRNFDGTDTRNSVIVSRRVAMETYGSLDVAGQRFPKNDPLQTIIGVVEDAAFGESGSAGVGVQYSLPNPEESEKLLLLARTRTPSSQSLATLLLAAGPGNNRVLPQASFLNTRIDSDASSSRLASVAASIMALLTLLLACFGIFGTVAHGASTRAKEIGIRLALGASRTSIIRLFFRTLAWPFGIGLICGVAGGVSLAIGLATQPIYMRPFNPQVYALATIVLFLSSMVAALIPIFRAVRIDPLRSLRRD